jgi:hypothetical protein
MTVRERRRSASRAAGPGAPFALVLVLSLGGCAARVPDPRDAALAYAAAARGADADGVDAMLSEDSKRRYTEAEVKVLVDGQRAELAAQADAVSGALTPRVGVEPNIVTEAAVPYADGEQAALVLEDGAYRIGAADALPAESRTVEQALGQLRRVIARRSYQGLLRVLTPRSRAALEEDMRSLVLGLEEPDGLDVKVSGDAATVSLPGGHFVRLRREAGVWRVEDFD